jgi:hypothetical protein
MPLPTGSKPSFYEVLDPHGAGTRREAIRAQDLMLGREVALAALLKRCADAGEFE